MGVALAAQGGYDAPNAVKTFSTVVDFITLEREMTHHYFLVTACRFAVNNEQLTDSIREGQGKIFSGDLNMLERQQVNLLRHPDRRLLKLNSDDGRVRSRMMIDRAIEEECVQIAPVS